MYENSKRRKLMYLCILIDSGYFYTILMENMMYKIKLEEDIKTLWKTLGRSFTTTKKVKINLCLPELISTKIVI